MLVAWLALGGGRLVRHTTILMVPLLLLTVVFDNVLTTLPIVTYTPGLNSGVRIGTAPVEDFTYTIALALLVPVLWRKIQ